MTDDAKLLAEIRALCEVANQEVFLRDYSPHPHEERNAAITEARTKLKQQARHWFPKLLRLLDEAAVREAWWEGQYQQVQGLREVAEAREARLLDSLLRISAAGDMASRMNWEPTMQWALDELAMVKKIARAALADRVKP